MELDITMIEKLKGLLGEIRKFLPISLFAVIQREDVDSWDLVISGDNIEKKDSFDLIAKSIGKIFEKSEIVKIPRTILLELSNPVVDSVNQAFAIEGGVMKIQNSKIGNVFFKNGYLFYSKKIPVVKKISENKYESKSSVKSGDITSGAKNEIKINPN